MVVVQGDREGLEPELEEIRVPLRERASRRRLEDRGPDRLGAVGKPTAHHGAAEALGEQAGKLAGERIGRAATDLPATATVRRLPDAALRGSVGALSLGLGLLALGPGARRRVTGRRSHRAPSGPIIGS